MCRSNLNAMNEQALSSYSISAVSAYGDPRAVVRVGSVTATPLKKSSTCPIINAIKLIFAIIERHQTHDRQIAPPAIWVPLCRRSKSFAKKLIILFFII
jgi:hypothetical protein